MALNAHALTTVVHVVHYGIVAVGVVVVIVLLAPARGTTDRRRQRSSTGTTPRSLAGFLSGSSSASFSGSFSGSSPGSSFGSFSGRPAPAVLVASVCSLAAAGVHAAVGPEHFGEGLALGLFFVVAALAQVAWAVGVLRLPSPKVLLLGVIGNAAVIVLWIVTRTVGLPFGLLPGPEAVGTLDIVASTAEVGVVVAAGLALAHRPHRRSA